MVEDKIIDGVEVYYSGFDAKQIRQLENFCDKYKLLMSGGTDCHGTRKPVKLGIGLGNLNIPEKIIENWI